MLKSDLKRPRGEDTWLDLPKLYPNPRNPRLDSSKHKKSSESRLQPSLKLVVVDEAVTQLEVKNGGFGFVERG